MRPARCDTCLKGQRVDTDSNKTTPAGPLFGNAPAPPAGPEAFAGSRHIRILPDFARFRQPDDMFSRAFWDPRFANRVSMKFFRSFVKPGERMRDEDGFTQLDYAVRNGPWVVTEQLAEIHKAEGRRDGFTDDFSPHILPRVDRADLGDPRRAAAIVKKVARLYGADLVGIADYDPRWTYGAKFSARALASRPVDLPEGLTSVIVVGKAMDYDVIRMSPSATASTGPATGYAHDATTLLAIAQFLRHLGFEAVANQNDTTVAVPYALAAGLGEYGRNGLVITPEYGPRVRFGRILTNLPLAADRPRSFGVEQTCEICRRCANNCPPQAIDHGAPSDYRFNRSNIRGVRKWTTDGEKCFKFWVSRGTDCANCVRVCPYNKDMSRPMSRVVLWMLARAPFRRLGLWLDDRLRWHDQISPKDWWRGRIRPLGRAKDSPPDRTLMSQQDRLKALRDKQADSRTD
jgi:ferredoxin